MEVRRLQSLGWEGPLEKEMAIHSRILAREIPWTEEPGGLQSTGSQTSQASHSSKATLTKGAQRSEPGWSGVRGRVA